MANKKVSQLVSKPSVLVTDLFPIADPTTGQLYKTTISDLGTAIGSGVSSVNTLVGAVVLDTDDIQELASPTNRWFTDTRARAAISGGTGISYNSGTGVITNAVTSGQIATALGYTPANGANYLPLAGGTMGGAITGTTATFASSAAVTALGITLSGATGDGVKITHSAGRAFNIQSSGTGFGILINNETASTSAPFTIQKQGLAVITLTDAGAGSFASSLTANSFVKTSGTSSQFLKADGSVDSTAYQAALTNPVTGTGTSGIVAKFNGTSTITDSIIYDNGTRVSIGANVTTSNTFTAVASTTSAYAVVAQASGAANGFWAVLSGTGEIFRGQTNGGSYFIVNNGGNAFLNGNLNIGDFGSTSFKLNVIGTANITGALSGTSATFSQPVGITTTGTTAAIQVTLPGNANATILSANSGNAAFGWKLQMEEVSTGDFRIFRRESGVDYQVLNLARATGAATFSSSVTANGFHANAGNSARFYRSANDYYWGINNDSNNYLNFGTFAANGTAYGTNPKLILLDNGNVGIGTTAPDAIFHVAKTGTGGLGGQIVIDNNANDTVGNTAELSFLTTNGASGSGIRNARIQAVCDNAGNGATNLQFWTWSGGADTERMRITSGGNFLINSTSDNGVRFECTASSQTNQRLNTDGVAWALINDHKNAGAQFFVDFRYNGTGIGTIQGNNSSVSYNTSSDYRLKEDLKSINGLEIVNKIKVYDYKWKATGHRMDGVLAHELAEVLPYAVSGVKDGEVMQGVDYSKIVPVMVQAIKELKAELDTLKNK
jgi:hypothetical protein